MMRMIYSGSLYVANENTLKGVFGEGDLVLHTYVSDNSGNGFKIVWIWRPEAICMVAYANPESVVLVDTNGYRYTGQMLERLIQKSSMNDYSLIKD